MSTNAVAAAQGVGGRRMHFAVYHTWPDIKNAEYEIVLRLLEAGRMVGADVSVIDNNGYVLSSTKSLGQENHRIGHGECDFAISLHFESPKTVDIHSYAAIWNPIDFYFSWGYEQTVPKFLSHNDLLSCGSDIADAHALNVLESFGRLPLLPLPRFYHSVPGATYAPIVTQHSRVFYVGINWERIKNEHGRHHEVLLGLDRAGLIDIYGPEVFQGIKPWEGYKGYRGSIPFDGRSLVRRIARSGICLAFSSAAHQRSGIMSSRLFEALAAGALVIANRHPFVEKYFADKVHIVDDSQPAEAVLNQIIDIVERARAEPAEANRMAKAAHDLFIEQFSMDRCLATLIEAHAKRVPVSLSFQHRVDAVVKFTSVRLTRLAAIIQMLERQRHPLNAVTIIVDVQWYERNTEAIDRLIADSKLRIVLLADRLFDFSDDLSGAAWRSRSVGRAVYSALVKSEADYFLLMQPEDEIFHDHVDSLARALSASEKHLFASSGVLIESRRADMVLQRRLGYLTARVEDYLFANQVRYSASHMYRRAILNHIPHYAFDLLDGEEHNLLNHIGFVHGQVAFTNYASYVFLEHEEARRLEPFIPVEQQHQYIRDTCRSNIQQLAFLRVTPLPQVVFASPTGTAIQWEAYRHARDRATRLKLARRYDLRSSGDGLVLISRGFYGAEPDGVWVEGKFAELEFIVDGTKQPKRGRYTLRLDMEGRNEPESRKRQFVTVVANGFTIGEIAVESQWAEYAFEFGTEVLDDTCTMKLRLLLDHAGPIVDAAGEIKDPRQLGLRLRALTLT